MIVLILTIGCIFFLFIGFSVAYWAEINIQTEGSDIKNIIIFILGIAVIIFGFSCVDKAGAYYRENENPKTEIVTSTPLQIDTVITTRNSVSDTTYIYKFDLIEK